MKTPERLFCKLFVDCALYKRQLLEVVAEVSHGKIDDVSVLTEWGAVDVTPNSDRDEVKKHDEVEGFLYYPFVIEMDRETEITRSEYVRKLRLVIVGLRARGCKVVAACDFEDELLNPAD